MTIDGQTQQLAAMDERAHKERKYDNGGKVCSFLDLPIPVLIIGDVQYRLFHKCDIRLLPVQEMRERSTNGCPTAQVYAAEFEGGSVTVIRRRVRSETTDETLAPHNSYASIDNGGDLPVDLTVFKCQWSVYLPMCLALSAMLISWKASTNRPDPRLLL